MKFDIKLFHITIKLDEIDNNDNLDEDQKREFMFNEFIATYDNGI